MELLASIKELLLLNDCVIIPGFGGFVSSYQPAGWSASRFTPPAKTVSFNKKLNFNDGLFINDVAEKEGINYFLAGRKVNLLVEEMNYRLTDGEEIGIPEIGTLHYDDHENLIFTPRITGNLNPDSFGLTPFHYETRSAGKSSRKPVPLAKRDAAQVIFQRRALRKVMVAVPLLLALAVTPLKNNKENLQVSGLANVGAMMTAKEPVSYPETRTAPEAEVAAVVETPLQHAYFIIGGSFKSEDNAANLITLLKDEGYPAQNLGIIQGLHYVAVAGFATLEEAKKARRDYDSKVPGTGAWIYVRK
ncbi:MAG: SPOR domain-containing protein [Mangrovibacterium sp.]|nr:SPOR domain-containing protein [Mangrovibacterium sp.]